MAVKRLQLIIAGDAKGALKALGDTGSGAEQTGSRAKAAFGAVAASLSSAFGPALGPVQGILSNVSGQLDTLKGKGKSVGTVMTGAGVAATGAGAALTLAASGDIASQQQLQAAITATGGSWDQYKDQVDGAVKHNEKFGDTASQTYDSVRILTSATNSTTTALKYQSVAADLAAARHESLSAASEQLAKVINGKGSKTLSAYGITFTKVGTAAKALTAAQKTATAADDASTKAKQRLADVQAELAGKTKLTVADQIRLRDAEANVTTTTDRAKTANQGLVVATVAMQHAHEGGGVAVDELAKKLKGQAAAAADTWKGKLEAVKAKLEDTAASIGQKYGPAITAVGAGMSVLGAGIEGASSLIGKFRTAQEGAQAATEGVTAAQEGENVAMDSNPIGLIVLAIAGLVAGLVYAYKHVTWFRDGVNAAFGFIKKVVSVVVDFIGKHWKVMLAILTGGVSVAVLWIVKHWQQISDGFNAVVHFVGGLITGFVGFFTALPGRIQSAVGDLFSSVWRSFENANNWVFSHAEALLGYFLKLPGRVTSAVGGIFDGLWQDFRSAVNLIIRGWNGLHFGIHLPHIPGTNIGGNVDVGVPQIPYLHTGGVYKAPTGQREGLAMLLDGERVLTRSQQSAMGGGAVPGGATVIHVHFEGPVYDLAGAAKQMVPAIRTEMIRAARNTPGPYLPGVA